MRSSVPGTCSSVLPSLDSRRATVSVLALRRVSACALPRPSATASARLAKTTVSHSQAVIAQPNQSPGSLTARTVVSTEPTSDHEHHGGLDHHPRVELAQRVRQGLEQLLGVEQPAPTRPSLGLVPGRHVLVRRPGRGGGGHGVAPRASLCRWS